MDANKEQKLKAFLAQIVSSDLQGSPEAGWISSRPRTNSNIAKTRR